VPSGTIPPVHHLVDGAVAAGHGDHGVAGGIAGLGDPPRIASGGGLDQVDRPAQRAHAARHGIDQPATTAAGYWIQNEQDCPVHGECHPTVTTDSRPRNGLHTQSAACRAIAPDRFSAGRVFIHMTVPS